MAATPKYKSKKGKRHPAFASSFKNIGKALQSSAIEGRANTTPERLLKLIAEAFLNEAKRLRRIVR